MYKTIVHSTQISRAAGMFSDIHHMAFCGICGVTLTKSVVFVC